MWFEATRASLPDPAEPEREGATRCGVHRPGEMCFSIDFVAVYGNAGKDAAWFGRVGRRQLRGATTAAAQEWTIRNLKP